MRDPRRVLAGPKNWWSGATIAGGILPENKKIGEKNNMVVVDLLWIEMQISEICIAICNIFRGLHLRRKIKCIHSLCSFWTSQQIPNRKPP
jgi:hypothetical protein